jgi:phytol kinase
MSPWLGLFILLAAGGLWLLLVRWLRGLTHMESELSRKLFHAGSGAILLSMPWLFTDIWPVLLWGLAGIIGVSLMIFVPGLKERFGGGLYDVGRVSYGDIYFVIGVVALFFFAAGNKYLFVVPLLMLSFADASSALIGKRFGRIKYDATDGYKSVEGSAAFFAVAFLSTLLCAPLLPNVDYAQVLLIATILGLLVMMLEAIAWRGLDNLLIPLGGFILLRTFLMMNYQQLALNLLFVVGLVAFVLLWRHRTTLNDSALITGVLFGYTAWTVSGAMFPLPSLHGWLWLLMPVTIFVIYNLYFGAKLVEEHHAAHNVDAVFSTVFAGAVWLYLAFYFDRADYIFPYALAFCCVAMVMYLEQRRLPWRAVRKRVMSAVSVAILLLFAGALWSLLRLENALPLSGSLLLALAVATLAGIALAVALRFVSEGVLNTAAHYKHRWVIRAAASLAGSALGMIPLHLLRLGAV